MAEKSASSDTAAELQTPNLFIDTSIFRKKAFDLTNESLKKLDQLGQERKIFLYSTFITIREMEKNLIETVADSFAKLSKLNVQLRNAGHPEIDGEAIRETRMGRWREFIVRSNLTLVDIPDGSIERVFDLYFSSKPPFHTNANKRSEFPDAFILAALKNWCEENEEPMYVVSDDDLFRQACDGTELLPLKSVEEFINLFNKREEFFYQLALSSFEHLRGIIEKEIKAQIEGRLFDIPDLWDADVADVEVTDLELHEPLIIEVNEEFSQVDVDADIRISAHLTYPDPEFNVWDSETKDLVSYGDCSQIVSGSFSMTVSLKFFFHESRDPQLSYLDEVKTSGDIRFRVISDELSDRYQMVSYPPLFAKLNTDLLN